MKLFGRHRTSNDDAPRSGAPGKITAGEAARAAADGRVLLLDVREPGEWAAGHAPDAVHLPLGSLNPQQVPADRPVVTVCRSGNRSAKAAAALHAAGREVSNLTGGMQAWTAAGLPITRGGTPAR